MDTLNACYFETETPVGRFYAAVDDQGAVIAAAFGELATLQRRAPRRKLENDPRKTDHVRREVLAYFADPRHVFTLELRPAGSPFQQRVWNELRRIPAGETRSYGALAAVLGSSPRAVGRANATNPVCLFAPCHRVIGADGSLTGFAFGESLKRALLAHERVPAFMAQAA